MFNRIISVSAFLVTAAMASAMMPVSFLLTPDAQGPQPIPGQIFVKIKPGKTSAAASLTKKIKGKVVTTIPRIGWQLIKLPAGTTYEQAAAKYKANSAILETCPNYAVQAFETSVNDPRFAEQYSLRKMQVPLAWDYSMGSSNTIVAVLDSGVDYNHPDLKNKVIKGFDYAAGDNDPMDVDGHGTHVAGIVAAETNNGIGVAGNGYKTTILAVRVLGDTGSGSFDGIANGIVYAADNGANIINMSLGSYGLDAFPVVDDAIDYAYNTKNVLIFASAGNAGGAGNPIGYPAYNSTVIAVGASDENDNRSDFSEYNPADGSDNWVDIAAPGSNVLSTFPNGAYGEASGTSMASPNAAGAASLIWTLLADFGVAPTNDDVRRYIEENTDNVGKWVNYGRVNVYKSLLNVGTPIDESPVPTVPAPYDGTVTYPDNAFSTEDGVSATIRSVRRPGVGLTGSFTTSFEMKGVTLDELRTAQLTLSVTGEPLATIQIFLQDLSGTWKMLSSQPGRTTGKTTDYSIVKSDLVKYMTGAGRLNVMVRSFAPVRLASRLKGVTKVDLLKVTFKGVRKPGSNP